MVDSGNNYKDKVSQLISWGHWFSFFNIIAAMLLGTRYIAYSGWPETLLGQTYQIVTWIGHFGFLVFAVYILLIFPATFIIFPAVDEVVRCACRHRQHDSAAARHLCL